jgi:hypothetical protein
MKSILFKIFVVLFGIFMIVASISALQSNSSNWPGAEAKVVSSERAVSTDNETDPGYDLTYTYKVDGVVYSKSTNVSSEYRPGDIITAYYDPASPDSSILSRGEMEMYGFGGLLFGLFCVGGVIWDVIKARFKKDQQPAEPAPETIADAE